MWLWLLTLTTTACLQAGDASLQPLGDDEGAIRTFDLGLRTQHIVYGQDDRLEFFEHQNSMVQGLARHSTIALIEHSLLDDSDPDRIDLTAPTLQDAYGLCESERFLEQPVAAECSGVLISPDLLVTAAHCFSELDSCDRYAYVFDYFYEARGELAQIEQNDVYQCSELVSRVLTTTTSGLKLDFALVRLERPVSEARVPAMWRMSPMKGGERLHMVGFGSGLPAKLDSGSQVLESRQGSRDYFTLDADSFAGSSGSGIFDEQGLLTGILVRGGVDYVRRDGCRQVHRVTEDMPRMTSGEHATYMSQVMDELCTRAAPLDPLCMPSGCRDDNCSITAIGPRDLEWPDGRDDGDVDSIEFPGDDIYDGGGGPPSQSHVQDGGGCQLTLGESPGTAPGWLLLLLVVAGRRFAPSRPTAPRR